MLKTNKKTMDEPITLEYYDREKDYHGVGTFYILNDRPISSGDKFIVPPIDVVYPDARPPRGNGIAGCMEGRHDHPAYGKPILLTCKFVSEHHVATTNGYGSWIKSRCLVELN